MPNEFISKMAKYVAHLQQMADRHYYGDRDHDMVDYYATKVSCAYDICVMFQCAPEVWDEAQKIYDFRNSGKKGYTLKDGKIVKVDEV